MASTALIELRDAQKRMRAKMPGEPSVQLPLDAIICYVSDDGETKAVINVEQVIYLVDTILRQ